MNRWNFGPVSKISLRSFSSQIALFEVSAHAHFKMSIFWHFKTNSYILRSEICKTLKLSKLYLLDKESWLMKPFSIFDDFVKNPFLICKLHINHVNYRHYFRKGVPGKNFKFIPYLEVEILCGGGVSLYVYYSRAKLHARKVNPFLSSQVSKILLHPFIFIETKMSGLSIKDPQPGKNCGESFL